MKELIEEILTAYRQDQTWTNHEYQRTHAAILAAAETINGPEMEIVREHADLCDVSEWQ